MVIRSLLIYSQMNQSIFALALWFWSNLAAGAVLNIEFKFTPFVGDTKQNQVETVAGKARVYINNVFFGEQSVTQQKAAVQFDSREVTPSVWVPGTVMGAALRKGRNRIRIEFEPADSKRPYRAQLRWASVTDQIDTSASNSKQTATNQSNEGVEEKNATGKVSFEREFNADFATELPWHKYPAVTTLSDSDRRELESIVKSRADAFKPNFAALYTMLKDKPGIDLAQIQKMKCLDEAYQAGVRVIAIDSRQLDLQITGNPEVMIRAKSGDLFRPADMRMFEKIKEPEVRDCAGALLFMLYPSRMAAVKTPAGKWEVAY